MGGGEEEREGGGEGRRLANWGTPAVCPILPPLPPTPRPKNASIRPPLTHTRTHTHTHTQTAGNDAAYRSPLDVEENLFVTISSPSTSRYASVADLGPPSAAAEATLTQYLTELMSTRLGVKRRGARRGGE